MKTLTLYRILSYILLLIAFFLGLAVLLTFFVALVNPALLLNVFIAAAVVMYSFSSFLFVVQGIDSQRQLKPGMKDFIRVNAFVAIVFGIWTLFQSIAFISNQAIMNEALQQFPQMNAGKEVSKELIAKVMKATMWFLLIYSILLLTHIQITFRLLKQYASLFGKKQENNNEF